MSVSRDVDMTSYVPGLNPKFVQHVYEKRRREARRKMREAMKPYLLRDCNAHVLLWNEFRQRTPVFVPNRVETIIREVAAKHGVSVEAIKGRRKDNGIVAIRHEAMVRAYLEAEDLSLPQISRIFKRDHTSLLHAVQKAGVWRNPGRQGQ